MSTVTVTREQQRRIAVVIIGAEVWEGLEGWWSIGVDGSKDEPEPFPAADSWLFLGPLIEALLRLDWRFVCLPPDTDFQVWNTASVLPMNYTTLSDAILSAALAVLEAAGCR